jgi:hypothetical protein
METAEKILLFKKTLRGRTDVVPRYWQSRATGKAGYAPICRNEWKEGVCQKPCRSCPNADYVPLSDELVMEHFRGNHILGVYPLLEDNTCHFIAADLDNHDGGREPLKDVQDLFAVCEVQEIPSYTLRSKSGAGYHSYLFFGAPVPAWKARLVYFALLREAMVLGDDIELTSFDRLFPNQDELSGKGFGNLIGLPFQGQAAKKGNTLFLDPETGFEKPYPDQWQILADIRKISGADLDRIIDEWKLKRTNVRTYNGTAKTPDTLDQCHFFKWAKDHPGQVKEPLWYAVISNALCVRPGAYTFCHEISKGHPGYNRGETDSKIFHALDASGPHTCAYIRDNGFTCPGECKVKAPAGLLFVKKTNGDPNNERTTETERPSFSFV